jgi:KDO2-lipid IV(A) lauroyltransferase
MDTLLYFAARAVIAFLQALPLRFVALMGRAGGALAYLLDARHRRVAVKNLTMCFGQEKSPAEIRSIAKETFRRIGENFACAAKTASMTHEELQPFVEFVGDARILAPPSGQKPPSIVVAIGHFGNFELYARFGGFCPAFQCATTYRGLRQPSLNRLMQDMRERSGCLYFERRTDASALKAAMNQPGTLLGLLADQHAGDHGLRIPFLGHDCSTSAAPAVFALRYRCALFTGVCYRVGLARWRIEGGREILTHENGAPRSSEDIMRDVNAAFEQAVRRDPANWFWVHNRWKPARRNKPKTEPEKAVPADAGDGS